MRVQHKPAAGLPYTCVDSSCGVSRCFFLFFGVACAYVDSPCGALSALCKAFVHGLFADTLRYGQISVTTPGNNTMHQVFHVWRFGGGSTRGGHEAGRTLGMCFCNPNI